MKKFLIFLLLVVSGYFAYDYFLAEKELYEITASYNKQRESVDINAPSIQPADYSHYSGTIKNISEKTLKDLTIIYMIDAQQSTASLDKLEPGEMKEFKTSVVRLRHMDPSHYLKEVTFKHE